MKEKLKQSINEKQLIGIKTYYNEEALFYYLTKKSNKFILGVEEFDFKLEGYHIRKIEDIEDCMIINNFSAKINELEGLKEQIKYYDINLSSYQTIFNDLVKTDQIISIEREYNDLDNFFLIGKIIKVNNDNLWFRDFDVDGNWNEEINIIPYNIITTIRFNTNYTNIWQKYLKEG